MSILKNDNFIKINSNFQTIQFWCKKYALIIRKLKL